MSVSYDVLSGEVTTDDLILALRMDDHFDISYFINNNEIDIRHLRLLVSKPSTHVDHIRQAAKHLSTEAPKAVDFCSKEKFANVLLEVGKDATDFSFYNQEYFLDGNPLHDDSPGADAFRRKHNVYAVLSARILYGGKVLPVHVSEWYDEHGTDMQIHYMDGKGDVLMGLCYKLYKKRLEVLDARTVEVSCYEFMNLYAEYTKYLPIYLHIKGRAMQRARIQAMVESMKKNGASDEMIMNVSREVLDTDEAHTEAERKRARKMEGKTCDFVVFVGFVADAPREVGNNVVSFLGGC